MRARKPISSGFVCEVASPGLESEWSLAHLDFSARNERPDDFVGNRRIRDFFGKSLPFFGCRIATLRGGFFNLLGQGRMNRMAARNGSKNDVVGAVKSGARAGQEVQFCCHFVFVFLSGFIAFDVQSIPDQQQLFLFLE